MKNQLLIDHLKAQNKENAGLLNRLKISYRPLICPFTNLLEILPEKASVFDVGCGSGMFLSLVQEFRNPKKLGGIEISEELIENARSVLGAKGVEQTDLFVFDGKTLPDNIGEFDYIFMIDVYHHIPPGEQKSFMANLIERMAPGATLVFKDIEGASILSYWNKVHDLLLAGEIGKEPKSRDMRQFFAENGQLEEVSFSHRRMLLYPHFTLVMKKK